MRIYTAQLLTEKPFASRCIYLMSARIFGSHYSDPTFKSFPQKEMMGFIEEANERSIIPDAAAYVMAHLVRALYRDDLEDATESDEALCEILCMSEGSDEVEIKMSAMDGSKLKGGPEALKCSA